MAFSFVLRLAFVADIYFVTLTHRPAAAPKPRTSSCEVRGFFCPRFASTSISSPEPKDFPRNYAAPLLRIYAQQKARNRPPWVPLPAFLFAYFSRRLCFLPECRVRDALAGGFIGLDNSVKLANAYFPCTSLLLWHWGCVDAPNMPPFYRDFPHPNPRASPGGGPEPAFGPAAALCFSQCSTVTSSSLFRFLGSGAMGR